MEHKCLNERSQNLTIYYHPDQTKTSFHISYISLLKNLDKDSFCYQIFLLGLEIMIKSFIVFEWNIFERLSNGFMWSYVVLTNSESNSYDIIKIIVIILHSRNLTFYFVWNLNKSIVLFDILMKISTIQNSDPLIISGKSCHQLHIAETHLKIKPI